MPTASADQLRDAWDAELAGLTGRFSLVLRSGGGVVAERDAHTPHYPASTVKLAVLGAVLAERAAGSQDAYGRLLVHERFDSAAGGTFVLRQADDQDDQTWARLGEEVDVLALTERMITVSSNIAMDLLAERVGFDSVRRFLARAGLDDAIRLERLIGDTTAEASGITNSVTAAGLASLMAGLVDAAILDRDGSELALDILARQEHRGMIPAGLPSGTWSASKGGWVPGVNHDVALVRPASAPPYVLAVCTTSDLDHADGQALVARLSAITWEHWSRWQESPT